MKICIVTSSIPNRSAGTGPYFCFLMVESLLDAGHSVDVIVALPEGYLAFETREQRDVWADEVKRLGARCETVILPKVQTIPPSLARFYKKRLRYRLIDPMFWKAKFRYFFWPLEEDVIGEMSMVSGVLDHVVMTKPDVAVVWCDYGVALSVAKHISMPHMIILGDPPSLTQIYWQMPPLAPLKNLLQPKCWLALWKALQLQRVINSSLEQHPSLYNAVYRYTKWFQKKGVQQMRFLRNLAPDLGGDNWRAERDKRSANRCFRILHVGNIATTVNKAGLHFLADKIIPALDIEIPDKYEVHLCGGGELSLELARKLDHPSVIRRGFVDDLCEELLMCDVFLVPTPIKLGGRVRIAYAWSTGACVVAHAANAFGLVEMKDGENSLLGENGAAVANAIINVFHNPSVKCKVENGGRNTFEQLYGGARWKHDFVKKVELTMDEADSSELLCFGSPATVTDITHPVN